MGGRELRTVRGFKSTRKSKWRRALGRRTYPEQRPKGRSVPVMLKSGRRPMWLPKSDKRNRSKGQSVA